MSVMLLSQMKAGDSGKVKELKGNSDICHRLLEMGITKDCVLVVVRFAPLGDPIDIKVRGYHLSLRRAEADTITVEINP